MNCIRRQLTVASLLWLAVLAVAAPEAAHSPLEERGVVFAQEGQSARERWEALSPEKRARIQARFERLKQMESEDRQQLEVRAQRLRRVERRVFRSMSDEDRARLLSLPPEKRSEILAELVEAELRNRGQRIEAQLPAEVRDWLAQASPEERRARLEQFKRDTRLRTSQAAVSEIAAALGYGEQEIQRFERLPIEERMQKVLQLQKRLTAEQLANVRLPRGLSAESWQELDALPPREYLAEILRLRSEGELGDALRRHPGRERARGEMRRRLRRELRVDPKDHLDLTELPPAERRAEIDHRRRVRIMRVLVQRRELNPKQLERLASLEDREFFRHLHRLALRGVDVGGDAASD